MRQADIIPCFKESHGAYIKDASTGGEYLDFCLRYNSIPIGYEYKEFYNIGFTRKINSYARFKPINVGPDSDPYKGFIESIKKVLPKGFRYTWLANTHESAVENALRSAFRWKASKYGCEGEYSAIHFRNGFHGQSGYSLSVTDAPNLECMPVFDWPIMDVPALKFPIDEGDSHRKTKRALKDIDIYCDEQKGKVACAIIEPIQVSGDNYFSKEFFVGLRYLANKHKFLLIYDEVKIGMGLTGMAWAHEYYDVPPDILCFGDRAQVYGIAARQNNSELKDDVDAADLLRGALIIDIILKNNLIENARILGKHLKLRLMEIQREFDCVSMVRGNGLMCALNLKTRGQRDIIAEECFEIEKLALLPCGEKSLGFRLVLNADRGTIDDGIKRLNRIICKNAKNF